MGKNKRIITGLCFLLTLCSCSGEKSYFEDTFKADTTISFDQLKDLAFEPIVEEQNYNLKYLVCDKDLASFTKVNCLGSELYICYNKTDNDYVFKGLQLGDASYTLESDIVRSSNTSSSSINYRYVANSEFPIFVYGKRSNTGDTQIVYADCYGKTIKIVNTDEEKRVTLDRGFEYNHTVYFYAEEGYSDVQYFKYTYKDNKYIVSAIEEREYSTAYSLQRKIGQNHAELTPMYDKNGEIFSYVSLDGFTYYIYDKNEHYLNAVNLYSFGMSRSDVELRFEKKICYYHCDEYYENVNQKSSQRSYRCRCLEIDLSNGEVSYDDDFKYYICDSKTVTDKNKYQYTYFRYYELNDKKETKSVLMCSVAKENLSFDKAFVYDGFDGEVYKIDRNTCLAKFDGEYYICTKDDRKLLANISSLKFIPDNKVIFTNSEGKYCICGKSEFVEYSKNPSQVYEYVSPCKYFGDYLKVSVDTQTNVYKAVNGGKTNILNNAFFDLLSYGLVVNNGGILLPNGTFVYPLNSDNVVSISRLFSLNGTDLFDVLLDDDEVYFFLEKVPA